MPVMPVPATGAAISRCASISSQFASLGRVERHRMVYGALGELMQSDIHA